MEEGEEMCIKPNTEKATYEEMKKESVKRLKILKFDEQIIQDFIEKDMLYVTDITNNNAVGATNFKQVMELVILFEKAKNVKIYHMINIEIENKVVVYLLYVKQNKQVWENEKNDLKKGFAEAYSYEERRETKYIGIETEYGKIKKVV